MQILIAEDNSVSTKLLAYLLEPYGNTEIVADGAEAVELVGFCIEEGSPFDLICLDIMMPNMDGWEALKQIRQLEEKRSITPARILVTTVVPEPEADSSCGDLYDAYLAKPYSKQQLLDVLHELGLDSN